MFQKICTIVQAKANISRTTIYNRKPTFVCGKSNFPILSVCRSLGRDTKELASQCLKITEKVSFNIASEASYIYILSGQKFMKNANGEFLINWSLRSNSITRQVNFNRTKIGGKFKCDILGDFQTLWASYIPFYSPFVMSVFSSAYSYLFWHFYSLSFFYLKAGNWAWMKLDCWPQFC